MRQDSKPTSKTIYARGAEDGLWMGLYISVAVAMIGGSIAVPALRIPAFALAFGVPFLTYYFLRRTHVAAHGMAVFSALWMQGIVMFACASLIFGALAFVYLRYIDPGFVESVFRYLIDFYDSVGDDAADALADDLREVADRNAYPRPAVLVLGEMWSIMFSGSLLSMIVSAVARIKRVPVSD